MSSIITDPQILANFSDAIESVLDNYNLGSVKRDYIRETILGRLEYEWKASPRFRSDIGSISDPDDQKRVIFSIVTQVAKTEIEAETRNLQVEAEKKIIAEAIKGNYFKKGGVKKAISDIGDWFGPFGRSYRKLSELKKDTDPDALRDTILDVVFPETQKGLKGVQSLFGQYSPEDDIELKASLVDTAIDVAFGKTIETKPRTLGFDSVNAIKVSYDKSLQALRDKRSQSGYTDSMYRDDVRKLKDSTKTKLDAIVREVNDHVIEENQRNVSGQFFDPKRAKFVGIAEATSFERKEGPPRFSVFSYEFDEKYDNLRIVDEVEDFYQEGVSQFLNVSPLTFVSSNTDRLKHVETLTALRELEIQSFRDFDFQNQGTEFYSQFEKNYSRFQALANDPNATQEVKDYFRSLEDAHRRLKEIRENAPSLAGSQVFTDVEEFKDLLNQARTSAITPAQQNRLLSLREDIQRHTRNGLLDTSTFSQVEREALNRSLENINLLNPASLNAVSTSLIDQGVLRRFGGSTGNDFVEFDSYVRKLITEGKTDIARLSAQERSTLDSLKSRIDSHLQDPNYSSFSSGFNNAFSSGSLTNLSSELNSGLINARFSNRSTHHRSKLGFSSKEALSLHLGDLESLLSVSPGFSSSFPLLSKPFKEFEELLSGASTLSERDFIDKKNAFYNKYVRGDRVFSLSSTLRDSFASASSIADFNNLLPQIRSQVLSQYVGAPTKDLLSLKSFMSRTGVANFNSLTDAQKKEFLSLKDKVLSHLDVGSIAYAGISINDIDNLKLILNDANTDFRSFTNIVTDRFNENHFNELLRRPELFFKSKFKEIPGFSNDLSSLLDLVYSSPNFSDLLRVGANGKIDASKQQELLKLVDKLKEQLNRLDKDGKYPLLNIDPDFKENFLRSLDDIRNGNFDNIRTQLIQLQSLSLFDQALQSKETLFKKLAGNKDFQDNLKKMRALSNAMSVLESMKSFKRLKGEELAKFQQYKAQLLRDLDLFGFTPAEITEITNALNSNKYNVIKKYFSAGIFGNKKIDLFSGQLKKDLLKIAHSTGDRKFSNAITRRILNSQITQSFVGRKMFEQLITGAQMATDYKFFKQEVKRTLQTLILNNVSRRWKAFLDNRVSNSAARNFIDNVVSLLREADKQKNPTKYFWNKFRGEVIDTFVASFIKRRFERFLNFKIFNKRYTLDATQLITNPIKYLSTYGKDILFREGRNFVYRKVILRYFKNNKYVKWYKVFRLKLARIKIRYNSILDQFMANPFEFIGKNFEIGAKFLWTNFSRYFPAVASRLATFVSRFGFLRALSFASLTNPVGWAVMVVVFVGPILLKPFFGNIDYFESLKRMLLFCCLLPFVFIFIIILVPILVLFNFAERFWDSVATAIGTVFTWNISDVLDSDSNWSRLGDPYKNTIDYRSAPFGGDFYLGGYSGGLGGNAYLANVGSQNSAWGSHCFIGNHTPQRLLPPAYVDWMNLDINNNELIKEADNDVSFSILCSASYHLSQVFPGYPSAGSPPEKGTISCHAGQPGFFTQNGGFTDRYWCTRIVVDSYKYLYSRTGDIDFDPSSVLGYYNDMVAKTKKNKFVEIKIEYDSSGFSKQCLPIDYLNTMSGAVTLFNYGDHTACDVNKMLSSGEDGRNPGAVSHVGLFFRINRKGLQFVQTNAGYIVDEAPASEAPCTATVNGQSQEGVRITRWFTTKGSSKGQYLCGMYFPTPSNQSVLDVMQSAPQLVNEPKPHKNLAGDRICPIPAQNNFNFYRKTQ